MRKEELRKLRALPATDEMMEKGKTIKPDYDALFRIQNLGPYIKIAVFLPKKMKKDIRTPQYEVFLNVAGGEYLTRELDDKGQELKWRTSMISNLPGLNGGWNYWSVQRNDFLNRDAMDTLNRLPLVNDKNVTGMKRLHYWQQEQKDQQTKLREQREQAPWDEDMKLVPKIVPDFAEWMSRKVAPECFIIYEYDPKGQKTGYCSKCKRDVAISNPRHGKETTCPHCKSKAVFKAHTKLQTLGTSYYSAEIIQPFEGGIVVRRFEQHQWYRDTDYRNPHVRTREYRRTMIFNNGTVRRYNWDNYKNKLHRWVLNEDGYFRDYSSLMLYKKNFRQVKRHPVLKQSAIDLWPELPMSTTQYLAMERGNPAVEMLARLGMFRMAKQMIEESYDKDLLNQEATEIAKLLKIDKSRLKRLETMDANLEMLKWMQAEKKADTIWPDDKIKELGENEIEPEDLEFLKIPLNFVQCFNYLKKQSMLSGDTLYQTLITWKDYTNMAEKMKMNTKLEQIAKPKNLKQEHDNLVLAKMKKGLEKQAKDIEKQWPKVNDQLPKLQKFEFSQEDYTIIAPKNVMDIVVEGTVLRHCVHTVDYYFSRIQTDESYLFFLRKSSTPDTPWYTLEVEPSGNIRQKRTTGDNQNADFKEAVKFLKKWQKYFKKQLTAEEIELGKRSDELRKKGYQEIREQEKRVWHGKLAGKLLADVLEADFMEAV